MPPSDDDERRHFHRITLDHPGVLRGPAGECAVTVHDISLHGACLRLAPGASPPMAPDQEAELELPLTGGVVIRMQVALRHREAQTLGCACRHIDIDSISELRRLVELNLGDPELLQRELAELAG